MTNVIVSFVAVLGSVLSSLGLVLPPDLKELLNLFWLAAERQPEKIPAMLLRGLPGAGKTSVAEAFALAANAQKFFFQCTPGTGKDEMVGQPNLAAVLKNDSRRAIADGILIQAAKAAIGGENVVLIIDELDKASPDTDAYLLDFLQSRRVRDTNNNMLVIPADVHVWVFFTSNQDRDLSDALMRRVRRVTAERPDRDLVAQILDIDESSTLIDIYMACEKLAISQMRDYLSDGGDPEDINWLILSQYCEKEDIDQNVLRDIANHEESDDQNQPAKVIPPMRFGICLERVRDMSRLPDFNFEYESTTRLTIEIGSVSELYRFADILVDDPDDYWIIYNNGSANGAGVVIDTLTPAVESPRGGIFTVGGVNFVAARLQSGEFYIPAQNMERERSDEGLLKALLSNRKEWREKTFRANQARKMTEARQEASVGEAAHLLKRLGLDDLV